VENNPASSYVVFLGKHITGCFFLRVARLVVTDDGSSGATQLVEHRLVIERLQYLDSAPDAVAHRVSLRKTANDFSGSFCVGVV